MNRTTRARLTHISAVAAAVLAMIAGAAPLGAHPHVWVVIESEIVLDGRAITGVRHRWTFDEGYSEQAIEGLDINKDGVVDRKELAELAKINMEALPQFGYFTELVSAGTRVEVAAPTEFWLDHVEAPLAPAAGAPQQPTAGKVAPPRKLLVLNFTLPLAAPLPLQPKGLSLAVRDPSFFIAFGTENKKAVRFADGGKAGCTLATDEDTQSLASLAQSMQNAVTAAGEPSTGSAPPPPAADSMQFNQVYAITCN